jgi:hypothetical protein
VNELPLTPVSSSWSAARATRCGTVSISTSCPTTRTPDGCQPTQVVRAGRSTDAHIAGSKEHYDRAMEIAVPLMRDLAGDLPQPSTEQSARHRHSPRRHRDLAAIRAGTPGPVEPVTTPTRPSIRHGGVDHDPQQRARIGGVVPGDAVQDDALATGHQSEGGGVRVGGRPGAP